MLTALSACGESGTKSAASTSSAAGTSSAASTSSAAGTMSSSAVSSLQVTGSGASNSAPAAGPKLTAAQLAAGLLPASAFGFVFQGTTSPPKEVDKPIGAVADVATASCYDLEATGESLGSVAHATLTFSSDNVSFVTQQIYQFSAGDAKENVTALANRLAGECAAFHDAASDVDVTVKVTPTSGLGDQALLVEAAEKSGTIITHSAMMVARYGDVVIAVTGASSDTGKVAQYDVAGKVKAVSAKLRLG
jgi:hypothetical protein